MKDLNLELADIIDVSRPYTREGAVATSIPELAKADKDKLGVYIVTPDGAYCAGDYDVAFTMQSVVKPLILLLALEDVGVARVRDLVGV